MAAIPSLIQACVVSPRYQAWVHPIVVVDRSYAGCASTI